VRLATLLVFGAGYVIGTRAGDERYAQIVAVAESASKRLEEYSDHHRARDDESERASRRRKAVV
jgi:cysteine sulfinate desulfinase/cysteine desulfurase-like protein